jgi:hypothetical protein
VLSLGAPGIYRIPPAPPAPQLTLVRTDIAGFVGYAERGPLPEDFPPEKFPPPFDAALVARRLTSWDEYRSIYGSFLPNGHLPYSVKGFFESGGDVCYVVRVAANPNKVAPNRQAQAACFALPAGPAQTVGALGGGGGTFSVKITLTPPIAPKDLVGSRIRVTHPGLHPAYNTVLALLDDGSFLLSAPLDKGFAAGDAVAKFPTAATVTAHSCGSWGNSVELRLAALDAGDPGAFALTVVVIPADARTPTELEVYRKLLPAEAATTLAVRSNLINWIGSGKIAFDALDSRVLRLSGGRDGFADVTLGDFSGGDDDRRGLRLLEEIDEVGVIAIPDAVLKIAPPPNPPQAVIDPCVPPPPPPPPPDSLSSPATLSEADRNTLQTLMIEQCERLNSRVAIIDPPANKDLIAEPLWASSQGLVNASAKYAALYFPWLTIPDPLAGPAGTRQAPPSGFIAGAYAQKDLSAGVWNPPANILLPSALDVAQPISNLQQAPLLDSKSNVNAIRVFAGEGVKIWGARSLAADDAWRFIHARRFMSAIEQTLLRSSRWAVFEVNDAALRKALTHSLSLLLEGVWSDGGLNGATPDQAFYVKCDETNNPQSVIDAGQVVCQVGVAIAAPMEFLVFQIRQDVSGGTVVER